VEHEKWKLQQKSAEPCFWENCLVSWDGLNWFSLIVGSYWIGGIPTAYITTRLLTGQDIRQLGDRNSGAANVFRNVDAKAGILVGIADVVKGAAVIVLVRGLVDSTVLEMLAGVAVLVGHNWPVHLRLRGGRGAATSIGVLLAMLPALAIPIGVISMVVLCLKRKSIIAIGFFLISVAVLAWPTGYPYSVVIYSVAVPVLVGLTHYFSVRALLSQAQMGVEPGQIDERMLPHG
jgi:glycerol-3-phosphate acyltransferase PlsY